MNIAFADARREAKAEGIAIGTKKGLISGRKEKALEDAKNFLNEGISIEIIARCTGRSIEQVIELKNQK